MTSGAVLPRRVSRRLGEGLARLRFSLRRAVRGFRLTVPERLLIAPQELEPGDPITARDIYAGHFLLAGRAVQTRGHAPFVAESPSAAWMRALHDFAWLRHFRDADVPMIRHHARALVAEWIATREASGHPSARLPEVTARRMIAWLMNAPVLLTETDHAFYQRFMRALARHAVILDHLAGQRRLGLPRAYAAIGYTFYSLCALTGEGEGRRAAKLLGPALADTILPDGCPIDRNPATALELASLLLPLKSTYAARGRTPPPELQAALDRLLGFIRLMRHANGELGLFNGMAASRLDMLGAVLDFDGGPPPASGAARHGGYYRMQRASTVVLADAGADLAPSATGTAHAGALAFELSANGERIVVNCGAAPAGLGDLHEALRQSAAHSTLSLDGISSATFRGERTADGDSAFLLRAEAAAPAELAGDAEGERLALTGTGYGARYGVLHRRALTLDAAGGTLSGEDVLIADGRRRKAELPEAVLRFHLHPRIGVSISGDGALVRLDCANGEIWLFEAEGRALRIEDSIFFGGLSTQRISRQIVVPMAEPETPVRWRFFRH